MSTQVVFTIMLALPIALAIYSWRRSARVGVRNIWAEAHTWEKLCLVLAFCPIPGPIDELVGALVISRILRRSARP
jgi:hypothetical protein